jgi:hypothetical protein
MLTGMPDEVAMLAVVKITLPQLAIDAGTAETTTTFGVDAAPTLQAIDMGSRVAEAIVVAGEATKLPPGETYTMQNKGGEEGIATFKNNGQTFALGANSSPMRSMVLVCGRWYS